MYEMTKDGNIVLMHDNKAVLKRIYYQLTKKRETDDGTTQR